MLTYKVALNFRRLYACYLTVCDCRGVHTSVRRIKVLLLNVYSGCKYNYFPKRVCTTSAMTDDNTFKLTDYDCVGFDLDNTLCKYKTESSIKMEYGVLSKFLVESKGYDGKHLLKPVEEQLNYIQKGLMLDFESGNVLQIGRGGSVLQACHGTTLLNDDEVKVYYGPDRKWSLAAEFYQNILDAWNGPLSLKLRCLLDSFDMPASLAFARIIDTIDEKEGRRLEKYNVWSDVLDGLMFMYQRENFAADSGGYFPSMKATPELYINRCSDNVISWLKQLKKRTKTFLVTGSNVDFASLVAQNSLGEHWLDYFDIVICYARKPGFFTSSRQFLALDEFKETTAMSAEDLRLNGVYSQGNWKDLFQFFAQITRKENPKCLYIGDNLIQDVFVPSKYVGLDTVAVVDNMCEQEQNLAPNSESCGVSPPGPWSSYFGSGKQDISIWTDITCTHAKICVHSVDVLAERPVDYSWCSFTNKDSCKKHGFHPNCPVNFL